MIVHYDRYYILMKNAYHEKPSACTNSGGVYQSISVDSQSTY